MAAVTQNSLGSVVLLRQADVTAASLLGMQEGRRGN